eukprot:1304213-Amphidinium_carterae.2
MLSSSFVTSPRFGLKRVRRNTAIRDGHHTEDVVLGFIESAIALFTVETTGGSGSADQLLDEQAGCIAAAARGASNMVL